MRTHYPIKIAVLAITGARGYKMQSKFLNKVAIPSLSDSSDFGLSDRATNSAKVENLLSHKVKDLPELNPNSEKYLCFYSRLADSVTIALVDQQSKELRYYTELKQGQSNIATGVTQVSVWRATSDTQTINMPTKVFDFILAKFGSIISDDIHTPQGKEFWKKRLLSAGEKSLPIGIINEETNSVDWKPLEIPTPTWIEDKDSAWGWEKSHLRFIIKKAKLEQY